MKDGCPAWASPELGLRRLTAAAADTVQGLAEWNLWATLTYREPAPWARCEHDVRTWLRYCAVREVRDHVPYFVAIDRQPCGRPHAHLLLAVPEERLPGLPRALRRAWWTTNPRAGHTKITRPHAEAALYAVRGHDHWDLNVACHRPRRCRRARGCVLSPGPWR